MEINELMNNVNEWVKDILQDNYVGVYFHGSLRLGSFNPLKSDLDFIIVVKDKISADTKKKICDVMLEHEALFPKKGFEFSVVLASVCHDFVYPTPYELHLSKDWIERYKTNSSLVINDCIKVDTDLASHFNVINVSNETMDFGMPSQEVFSIVPREYIFEANYSDIEGSRNDIVNNPTYTILNLCRFYAFIKDNLTLSKYDGGKWGVNNLPKWHQDIIKKAMIDYMGDGTIVYDTNELYAFANQAMNDIDDYLEKKML